MDIQSAELFETFVLFPVIIQGSIKPVRPAGTADCGIPKSLYDDQVRGLECLVDPWIEPFNVPTAKDDRVDLFINTSPVPVDGKTIAPGEENQRIRLYVPKGRLHDGFNQIYYRVTRASGNGSEDSRKLRVLYHRWAPGEPAPDSILLQISDEVVTNGVGLELATRGVEFGLDYSNRRPYDFISLSLGARGLVERELTPEEAEPGQSVTQTLYIDTFRKNPDNVRTPILYSATDQLGNFNQSVTRYIDVHVNRVELNPPVPAANPVDPLAYLQGMTIQVAFEASLPEDQARLIVVNMPDPPTFADLPLDAIHQATFNLQAGLLGAWHGTAVQFVWALIRGGEEIARSGPLVLNVSRIANGDTRLPTPVIAGQVGQELDVTKLVVTDLLSIAQWLLQAAGQYVWLGYDGFNSSGAPVFFDDLNGVPHNETQGLTRPLGQALVDWLNALKDKTNFTISFRVNFGKVADLNRAVTFPLREYTVSAVVDEKPAITSIKGASNGVEIPNGGTTVETAVVLTGLASKGQKVDVSDGKVSKGQPTADPTTGIWSLSVSGLNVDLYSYTATALYGSGQTSQAWTFTVIALVAPTISSIKGSPSGVEIRQGDYTVETTVVLTGMASKGLQVDVLDGTMSKGKPIANITTGVWTLTLSGLSVGSHRFTVKALYGSIPPSAERQFSIIPPYSRPTITNVVRTDTGAFVPSGSTLPRGVQLRVTGGCYSHPTKSRLLLLVGSNNHNGAVQLGTGVNSYTINEFGWATNAGYATYQARDELSGLLSQTAWGINWV
ncbi:hypothetical protein PMI22_03789 [Pseudomonas sp. GM21]|nr:hypothetical protein PMI22_03789 [Pseudomonas sp. GM21]